MASRKPQRSVPGHTAREDILAAAKRLMRRHGYDKTTMQHVVAEAGTSIGNAYFYFRNKDELLAEVIRRVLDERWAENERVIATLAPGPRRIATVIYGNAISMLGHDRKLIQAVIETQERSAAVRDYSVARWLPILADCCPFLSGNARALAATMIYGANRMLIGQAVTVLAAVPDAEIGIFAAQWSLRALGFADPEVDDALRTARRVIGG